MKKIFTSYLIALSTLGMAQTWTKVSGIMDSSQVKGIGVINNQILVAGQNWTFNTVTDYAVSNDGGGTWSKLLTYQFAGYLPNALPQNSLMICSNGFTFSKKLVGNTWQSFSGANNFVEFGNGSIIGSQGNFPDTLYNFSATGVKGAKLGNYKFKVGPRFCKGANNRVFIFSYGSGLAYIDYSNLSVINFPASLNGTPMTEVSWQAKYIIDMVRTSNGNLFACDYLNGGVIKSTDNGLNWTTLSTGYAGARIIKNSTDDLFIIAGNGEIRRSTDGGVTFVNINGNLPANGFKADIFVNTSDVLFAILNTGGGIDASKSGIFKFNSAIGLNELEKNKISFSVFPNPTNGKLTIETEELAEPTVISIANILGEVILNESLTSSQQTINLSGVKSGVYSITLKSLNKVSTQKLIVQ